MTGKRQARAGEGRDRETPPEMEALRIAERKPEADGMENLLRANPASAHLSRMLSGMDRKDAGSKGSAQRG